MTGILRYSISHKKCTFFLCFVLSWLHKWGLWCQKQVSQAGISNYILQFTARCNYLSLPEVPASGTKVLKYQLLIEGIYLPIIFRVASLCQGLSSHGIDLVHRIYQWLIAILQYLLLMHWRYCSLSLSHQYISLTQFSWNVSALAPNKFVNFWLNCEWRLLFTFFYIVAQFINMKII